MKHIHSFPVLLLVAAPLVAGCGSADVQVQPVTANVDVNATAGATAGAEGPAADSYDDQDPSALTDFHSALDSHGQWVDDPTYGTVWVPNQAEVGSDFTPYSTSGHWAMDNDDYVWVSDYDWGWAPFHYGRWVSTDSGWAWIPGREYRPAWVTWGADPSYGYVGWYPMGPSYVWRGGVAVSYVYSGGPRWNYVGRGDVFSANVGTHVLRGSAAASFSANIHEMPASGGGGGRTWSRGPAPSNLGVSAGAVPHASGAGTVKAQQFGHPSTATSMGGHAPTRGTATASGRGVTGTGTQPATGGGGVMNNPHSGLPSTGTTSAGQGKEPVQGNPHAGLPSTGTATGGGKEPVQGNPHAGLPSTGTATTTTSTGTGREPVQGNPHSGLPSTGTPGAGTPGAGTQPKKKNPDQEEVHPAPKGGGKPGPKGGHH
jgi:hypothetical protein